MSAHIMKRGNQGRSQEETTTEAKDSEDVARAPKVFQKSDEKNKKIDNIW